MKLLPGSRKGKWRDWRNDTKLLWCLFMKEWTWPPRQQRLCGSDLNPTRLCYCMLGPSQDSRRQFKINLHLSSGGFSASDSSGASASAVFAVRLQLVLSVCCCAEACLIPQREWATIWLLYVQRETLAASYAISWQPHKKTSARPVFPSRNYILLLYARVRNSPCASLVSRWRAEASELKGISCSCSSHLWSDYLYINFFLVLETAGADFSPKILVLPVTNMLLWDFRKSYVEP